MLMRVTLSSRLLSHTRPLKRPNTAPTSVFKKIPYRTPRQKAEKDDKIPSPEGLQAPDAISLLSEQDPRSFVATSSLFYIALTVSAIVLGKFVGLPVWDELSRSLDIKSAVLWTLPPIILFSPTIIVADDYPPIREIKQLLVQSILPMFRKMNVWELAILALGAGIGEEALFRGWLMPAIGQKLLVMNVSAPQPIAVISSSIVFGSCHAVTRLYFILATLFGVWLGMEYMTVGLPEAAFSHALYDFTAFIAIRQFWKTEASDLTKKDS